MQQNKDTELEIIIQKALIVPINSSNHIFIQDRRGHKKPDWGYFGGSIEKGETPIGAVIRETKEELSIDISEKDLIYLTDSSSIRDNKKYIRHMYLYPTDQKEFIVLEGKGGYWFTFAEVRERMDSKDGFDEICIKIEEVLKKNK